MKTCYDFTVIGGGIVGTATAWQLQQAHPGASILLLEKEAALACHQTGHNSGVIHAGVYYTPGSLKADFCRRGALATMAFCDDNAIPYQQPGKLLVATTEIELQRMQALQQRCADNDIECHYLDQSALRRREPHIRGLAALDIPQSGIVDYRLVTANLARHFVDGGGELTLNCEVIAAEEYPDRVELDCTHRGGSKRRIESSIVIACGGLMADRLCRMLGIATDFAIIPFRGEYYRLASAHNQLVKHMIYPIPDPAMPFLGVHLTPMIDGTITVGPNAVLGWKREGYGALNINLTDTLATLGYGGFWKMAAQHWRSAAQEMKDSFYQPGYLKRVQKYCPELTGADLKAYPAGIRAQAVMHDGSLAEDFLFAHSARTLQVCNAPSPAATSALPIGAYIVDQVQTKLAALG
ncbi:MAG: L-2-hydroxyglutarate oxidase [Paraglaciecola psychrophila]|jgi:L-2-hydroxyglutarate oxidase